ncbi:MAG: hypothetical protein DWQ05_14405 [Calditrichaeota bacterium]|nr:MAG: hypothetical protein DWQ05_14405 [Calditrichota bacterium]
MNEAKIKTLLGLAIRARKLAIGASAVDANLRKRAVHLILLANDAGANTERKVRALLETLQFKCPIIQYKTKDEIGAILNRTDVSVVGILDENFAAGIAMHAKADEK